LRKKPKLKDKGKKLYRNTHGRHYRVRLSYRLRYKNQESQRLRKLTAQINTYIFQENNGPLCH